MKNKHEEQELEGWLEDYGMEAMGTMTGLLKMQQEIALKLTKLVLEYCKEEKVTKDYIFNVFNEATSLINKQMSKDEE